MNEREIERRFVEKVRKMGGFSYKFVSPGRSGVPDRIVVLPPGRVLFVELKRVGGKLSPLQAHEIDRLVGLGCAAVVAYGLDEALEVLDAA